MSDCRFGGSPVNYPDPDPEHLPLFTGFTALELPRDVPDVALEQVYISAIQGSSRDYHPCCK